MTNGLASGITEKGLSRSALQHLTVLHQGDPITKTDRLIKVMGDKNDGALSLSLQLQKQLLHVTANQRIKR